MIFSNALILGLGLVLLMVGGIYSGGTEHHHKHENNEVQEKWWENLVETSTLVGFYTNDTSYDTWSISGNLAHYLQIPEIKKVTVPVLINLVLIGFDGFGNQMTKLSEEEVESWFGHIEHTLPHLIAPYGEEQTTIGKQKTREVPIEYRFHYNLVNLSPLFETILQDYILWNTRPERPEETEESFKKFAEMFNLQVDPADLVLDDDTDPLDYEIPEEDIDEEKEDYIKSLLVMYDDEDEVVPAHEHDESYYDDVSEMGKPYIIEDDDDDEMTQFREMLPLKYYYVNADHVSSFLQASMKALGLDDAYNIIVINPQSPVKNHEVYGYRVGFSNQELDVLYDIANPNPDVLLAKLNITMKPCDDNPKSEPLPSILPHRFSDKTIKVVDYTKASDEFAAWYLKQMEHKDANGFKDSTAIDSDDPSYIFSIAYGNEISIFDLAKRIIETGTEQEKDYLYDVIRGREFVNENCLVESWVSNGRMAFFDLTAGPFTWGPLVSSEGSKTEDTIPQVPQYRLSRQQQLDQLHDEQSRVQAAYAKECLNSPSHPDIIKFCTEMKKILENNEERISFTQLLGGEDEGANVDEEMDMFLSQLSAILSQSIRQLIVPPTALLDYSFHLRINFQFYLIVAHDDYLPIGKEAFDFEEMKREIIKLKFPNQEYSFTSHKINMKDSAEMSTAFYSSIRSTTIPTLSTSGYFYSEAIQYVDSKHLRDLLRKLHSFGNDQSKRQSLERTIPIFLFSLDSTLPIFVDKYYQSKALNDIVIAVQNYHFQGRSRYSCNSRYIYQNLRNPTKSILASVATAVGGVIPTHVTYNHAHGTALQNWMWSVGNNPLSQTSAGFHFNQFQVDIVKRNQIVDSMERSILLFNRARQLLSTLLTNENNYAAMGVLELSKLKDLQSFIIQKFNAISSNLAILDFRHAIDNVIVLESTVDMYFDLVLQTERTFDGFECLPIVMANADSDTKVMLLIPVLLIVLNITMIILILLCRGRGSRKEKVN